MTTELAIRPAPTLLRHPGLIVFVSSACMMVLELVAGRIVAPYVGVSLYTWTSIIGIVLAGMSLGNYLGGRMADRRGSPRLLAAQFLLASLFSLGILFVDILGLRQPGTWPIIVRILVLTTALFFLPSMLLGTISPVVAKLAVRDLAQTGSTIGGISAAGTVGSIVGTFATGFFLISWFGTHAIVVGVAVVLALMGFIFLVADRSRPALAAAAAGLLILGGGAAALVAAGAAKSPCSMETNYFCIKVKEEEREGEKVRILILDRLVHSYSSLEDPTKLVYGYEKAYAEATQYQASRHPALRALFIGGGGYTFPRYMEARYPGSRLDVIEIDPGVTRVAKELLGVKPDSSIASINEDARMVLARQPDVRYDLVMGDAFNDYGVPYHLTTQEFNERVHDWLADDGLYLVNLIDGPRRDFLRSYVATLQRTFPYVTVTPAIGNWRESPRITFVLIASKQPLDRPAWRAFDGGDGQTLLADQMLSEEELAGILSEGRIAYLTDRYAPVDQLLAPVFRGEEARPDGPAAQPAATPATPTPVPADAHPE